MKKLNTKSKCVEEETEICEEEMQKLKDALLGEECCDEDYLDMILDRDIILDGEITENCFRQYTMRIIETNKLDDINEIDPADRLPIKLYISCVGGDVLQGLSLCDVIKSSKTPIIAMVFYAYSMGGLIAMACDEVYCFKHSSFLIHDGAMSFSNSSGKVKDTYEFFSTKIEGKVKDFILENTKISKKLLDKNFNRDWYIDSQEALELGIVDGVIDYIK